MVNGTHLPTLDFPSFDGSDLFKWISKVDRFFTYFQTRANQCLAIAFHHMDDLAWEYVQFEHTFHSWNKFLKALVYCFGLSDWDERRGAMFIDALASSSDHQIVNCTSPFRRNAQSISDQSEFLLEGAKQQLSESVQEIHVSKSQKNDHEAKPTIFEVTSSLLEFALTFGSEKLDLELGEDRKMSNEISVQSEVKETTIVEFELEHERSNFLVEIPVLHLIISNPLPSVCHNALTTLLYYPLNFGTETNTKLMGKLLLGGRPPPILDLLPRNSQPLLHGQPPTLSFRHFPCVRQNVTPKPATTNLLNPTSTASQVNISSHICLSPVHGNHLDGYMVEYWIENAQGIFKAECFIDAILSSLEHPPPPTVTDLPIKFQPITMCSVKCSLHSEFKTEVPNLQLENYVEKFVIPDKIFEYERGKYRFYTFEKSLESSVDADTLKEPLPHLHIFIAS